MWNKIPAFQENDGGSYTCVAQNPAGVAVNQIALDVYTRPAFDVDLPSSMTVVAGEVCCILIRIFLTCISALF